MTFGGDRKEASMNNPLRWATSFIVVPATLALLALAIPARAGATPGCATWTLYEANQVTQAGHYSGVYGYMTDPSASTLQGTSSSKDDQQHLLLYVAMAQESFPPPYCAIYICHRPV